MTQSPVCSVNVASLEQRSKNVRIAWTLLKLKYEAKLSIYTFFQHCKIFSHEWSCILGLPSDSSPSLPIQALHSLMIILQFGNFSSHNIDPRYYSIQASLLQNKSRWIHFIVLKSIPKQWSSQDHILIDQASITDFAKHLKPEIRPNSLSMCEMSNRNSTHFAYERWTVKCTILTSMYLEYAFVHHTNKQAVTVRNPTILNHMK